MDAQLIAPSHAFSRLLTPYSRLLRQQWTLSFSAFSKLLPAKLCGALNVGSPSDLRALYDAACAARADICNRSTDQAHEYV